LKRATILIAFVLAIASAIAYAGISFHARNGSKHEGSVQIAAIPPQGDTNIVQVAAIPPQGDTNIVQIAAIPPEGDTNIVQIAAIPPQGDTNIV
jgi:hypothetical protein